MKDYITVTSTGENGAASINLDIDVDKLNIDFNEAFKPEETVDYSTLVDYDIEIKETIINGDNITITVQIDENLLNDAENNKIVINGTTIEYEVTDLQGEINLDEFDIFSEIYVLDEEGKVTVINESKNKYKKEIVYAVTKDNKTYTVTATLPDTLGGGQFTSENVEVRDEEGIIIQEKQAVGVETNEMNPLISFAIDELNAFFTDTMTEEMVMKDGVFSKYLRILDFFNDGTGNMDIVMNHVETIASYGMMEIEERNYYVEAVQIDTNYRSGPVYIAVDTNDPELKTKDSLLLGGSLKTMR